MPNLTARELTSLEDQLSAEQLLVKKFKAYAALSADPQLKTQYAQIAGQHQSHFDRLLALLS